MKKLGNPAYGLRDADATYINALKHQFPNGYHKTHYACGCKLPYNGVFYQNYKPKNAIVGKGNNNHLACKTHKK